MWCLLLLCPGCVHSLLSNVELPLRLRLRLQFVEFNLTLCVGCGLCLYLSVTALCQVHRLLHSRVYDRCSLVCETYTTGSRRGKLQSQLVRVSNLLLWANLCCLFLWVDITERLSGYIPYSLWLHIALHTASLSFSNRNTTEVEHALCTTELIRLNWASVDAVTRRRSTDTLSTCYKVRACTHTTCGGRATNGGCFS